MQLDVVIFWVTHALRGSLQPVMRNRFDQLAKQIGKTALEGSGLTVVHAEITPEPLHADLLHEPDPAKATERKRLGLLGRLVSLPCLLEPYSDAPSAEEFRACLTKHLAWWQQQARQHRADGKKSAEPRRKPENPFLWILCGGAPDSILTKLTLKATSEWPAGVYLFGDDVLRVGIVVARELPRERTTLLIRLMASAGPTLNEAIADLHTLPLNAYERSVAERPLLHCRHMIRNRPTLTPEEQEFVETMDKTWEDSRQEGHAEGLAEGRAEGRLETLAESVLAVLRVRGIAVPAAARKRILAQKDLTRLQRWHEQAVVVTSVGDLFKSSR
ncbi:MAG TPA: hypothetical protein VF516_01455 [Kofleriaceae bacterium]